MTPSKNEQSNSRSRRSQSKKGQREKELAFTRPKIGPEEAKSQAEEAAELLNSPIYNLAVNTVVDDLGMQMLTTEPHEHQKREWLYAQGAAIGRVNQKLVEIVQIAQALHMEEIRAEEAAQRESDSERGFGTA